jgi:hypothetical protein
MSHFDQALNLEGNNRLSHRCSTHAQLFCESALRRKAVPSPEACFNDVISQPLDKPLV